jgi:hypothetical protein
MNLCFLDADVFLSCSFEVCAIGFRCKICFNRFWKCRLLPLGIAVSGSDATSFMISSFNANYSVDIRFLLDKMLKI